MFVLYISDFLTIRTFSEAINIKQIYRKLHYLNSNSINQHISHTHTQKKGIFCTGLILEEGSENVKVNQKKQNTAASSVGNTTKNKISTKLLIF